MAVERPTLSRIWAVNGARYDPGMQKYAQGWTAEIPTYEVLNFLQYRIDTALLAATQRGVPEWGSDMKYEKGALVWDNVNSTIYTAKVASPNQQLRPSENSEQWAISATQFSMEQYHGLQGMINAHMADKGNPHGVTADQANTYTKAVIDQKVGVVASDIAAHAGRKDNPHGVKAEQIGAVPSSGGTYTGQVTFATGEVRINPGAGDHTVKATADRVVLHSGTTELGIRKSDGRAVLWKDGVADVLLNESQYVETRKAAEPDYAVPTPDFWVDALNDIHIRTGVGYTEFLRPTTQAYTDKMGQPATAQVNEPRHDKSGLLLNREFNERLILPGVQNYKGFPESTIHIEFHPLQGRAILMANGANSTNYLEYTAEGVVRLQHKGDIGPLPRDAVGTITLVEAGGKTRAYLNGVFAKEFDGDLGWKTTGELVCQYPLANTSDPDEVYFLRAVKIWALALTSEQISTL